jgi:hypothetical protein
MKMEIDVEAADKIVLAVLKEDYIFVKQNIVNLMGVVMKDDTPDCVKKDYEHDRKLLKSIKRVLRYYMIKEEYDRFIKENK